jgi:hypothetical protein
MKEDKTKELNMTNIIGIKFDHRLPGLRGISKVYEKNHEYSVKLYSNFFGWWCKLVVWSDFSVRFTNRGRIIFQSLR